MSFQPVRFVPPGHSWRPAEYLRYAEAYANCIRRLLSEAHARESVFTSVSRDDATQLAALIEDLARYGRGSSAESAFDIAERIEILIDLLRTEIDAILAS